MSGSIYDRSTKGSHRIHGISLLNIIAAAGLLGALSGLVDFLLFETRSHRPVVHELVLSKPGFWSLSFLSTQVVMFTLLASFLCLSIFLAIRTISRKYSFFERFSPLVLTVPSIFTLVVLLRLLGNSQQYSKLIWLTLWFLLVVVSVLFWESRSLKKKNNLKCNYSIREFIAIIFAIIFILLFSFFAPDLAFSISKFPHKTEIFESDSPNILLIVLDTVRADHLSCYGYTQNETPNIDMISREGLLFLNAFSTAPWTVPSHASMFTGLYTSQHGSDWGHTYLASGHLTLAEYLRGRGFRTAGFSENPFVGANHGLAQGFTEFHEPWRRPMIVRAIKKLNARLGFWRDPHEYASRTSGLFRRWIDNAGESKRPFFAYINFMAAHLPRYPRPQFDESTWSSEELHKIEPVNQVPERFYLDLYQLSQRDLSVMREVYDEEISYIDEHIGELYDFLNEREILENTVLIITSDHGENFGEHGFIEHQLCIYNSLIHVPLIIRIPKLFSPKTIDENVSIVGLFHTIAKIVGAEESTLINLQEGLNIFLTHRKPESQMIIAEYANGVNMMKRAIRNEAPGFDFSPYDRSLKCLIMDDYKYIWDSTGREELFHMGVDPKEEHDVASRYRSLVLRYRQMLAETTDAGENWALGESVPPPIDDATRDALRALGYEP